MVAQSIISSFFLLLSGGNRANLSDIYLCRSIYCFKGVGDVSQSRYACEVFFVAGKSSVFWCNGEVFRNEVVWATSEIKFAVRTLEAKYSTPNSASLA